MYASLHAALAATLHRLKVPHRDDGARRPDLAQHHARSIAFLQAHGLVPDARTRRYLDRAAVAEGLAIALPDLSADLFQLVLDWTNHNCLHDDAVEGKAMDLPAVVALTGAYTGALAGQPVSEPVHPLVAAMVAWRARALALDVDPGLLARFVERAAAMADQFVLERVCAEQGLWFGEATYLQQRVAAGPYDAWFALLDLVWGSDALPAPEQAVALRRLAVTANVAGNELRTLARELDQDCSFNLVLRVADPQDALVRLLGLHDRATEGLAIAARSGPQAPYARLLTRAVYATHQYELASVRGLAWSASAQAPEAAALACC